ASLAQHSKPAVPTTRSFKHSQLSRLAVPTISSCPWHIETGREALAAALWLLLLPSNSSMEMYILLKHVPDCFVQLHDGHWKKGLLSCSQWEKAKFPTKSHAFSSPHTLFFERIGFSIFFPSLGPALGHCLKDFNHRSCPRHLYFTNTLYSPLR